MAAVYLERAAECLRMAQRAGGTAEKASWLEMHESWLRLAKDRNAAPVDEQPMIDGFAHPPTDKAE